MQLQKIYSYPLRVHFDEVDAGGIVHHPNYLKLFERARTDAMFSWGIGYNEWLKKNIAFAVSELHLKYQKPLRYMDQAVVLSQLKSARRSSLKIEQRVYATNEKTMSPEFLNDLWNKDDFCTKCELRLVCIDTKSLSPLEIPVEFRSLMGLDKNHQDTRLTCEQRT